MSFLTVLAVVKVRPGKAAEARDLLQSLLAPTLAEAGCVRYEMNASDDQETFWFVEQWASRPEWDAHMQSPALGRFKARFDELVQDFQLHSGQLVRPAA